MSRVSRGLLKTSFRTSVNTPPPKLGRLRRPATGIWTVSTVPGTDTSPARVRRSGGSSSRTSTVWLSTTVV